MFELERLVTRLMGDATGLMHALTQAEQALTHTANHAANAAGIIEANITRIGGVSLATMTLIAGLGVAMVGVGRSAIHVSAEMEALEASFKVLIGSGEQATELLKELNALALTSPFITPQIMNAAVELSAFGRSAEEIIPDLKILGDISRGDAQQFKELVFIYGKVIESGRLYTRDINQLARRGIPVYLELAKSLGLVEQSAKKVPKEVMTQIRQQVQAGQIDSGMVEDIFRRITAPGGQFHGLMEARMNTLIGLFSNVREQVYMTLKTIGDMLESGLNLKPLLKQVAEVAGAFRTWLSSLSSETKEAIRVVIALTGVFVTLAATVTTALIVWNLLTGNVLLIVGIIGGLIGATSAWVIKIGGLQEAWYKVRRAAEDFWNFIKPILPALAVLLAYLNPPVGLVIIAVSLLITYWEQVKTAVEEFYVYARPVLTALWSLIKTIGFELREHVLEGMRAVGFAAGWAYDQIKQLWTQLGGQNIDWHNVRDGIRDAVLFIEYSLTHLNDVAQLVWESIKYGAIVLADEIIKNVGTVPVMLIGGFLLFAKVTKDALLQTLITVLKATDEFFTVIAEIIKDPTKAGEKLKAFGENFNKMFAQSLVTAVKQIDAFKEEAEKKLGKITPHTLNVEGIDIPVGWNIEGLQNLRKDAYGAVVEANKAVNQGFDRFKAQKLLLFAQQDAADLADVVFRQLFSPFMFLQEQAKDAGATAGISYAQAFFGEFKKVQGTVFGSAEHVSRLAEYLRGLPAQEMLNATGRLPPGSEFPNVAPMPHNPHDINRINAFDAEHMNVMTQNNGIQLSMLDVLKSIDQHVQEDKNQRITLLTPGLGL